MNAIASLVENVDLHIFAEDNIRSYGTYVVMQRALPDFRDGLKPVHRRILWAMHKMGIDSKGGFKKASRISGEVVGKYHPHGDAPVFSSMVSIAGTFETAISKNCPVPMIQGQGNWGELNTSPAAPRYVECKLSRFSDYNFFQNEYIAVADTHPNYDGEETEPLILPSLLPNLLLNGAEGIAVGVITGIPSFSIDSVKKIIELALSGKKVTAQTCLKYLKVKYQFGGKLANTDEEMLEFYNTGSGRLNIAPEYSIKNNKMIIHGVSPYFSNNSAKEKLLKNVVEISDVADYGDAKNPIQLVISFKSSAKKDIEAVCEKCVKQLTSGTNLRINVTKRVSEEKTRFYRWTMPELIENWCAWRVKLEVKAQQFIADKLQKEIDHLSLMVLACNNLDIIKKEIEKPKENLDERLAKALKITLEQSAAILAMTVRRLSRLSKDDMTSIIAKKKNEKQEALNHVKNPNEKILKDLSKLQSSNW